jgi:hypothetical protein
MNQLTHIGLDVHKDTIAVAVLRPGTTEVDERVIPNTPGSAQAAPLPPRPTPRARMLRGRSDHAPAHHLARL